MATSAQIIAAFNASDLAAWEKVDNKHVKPANTAPMVVSCQIGAPDPGDPPEGVSLYWSGVLLGTVLPANGAYAGLKTKFDAIIADQAVKDAATVQRYKDQCLVELLAMG